MRPYFRGESENASDREGKKNYIGSLEEKIGLTG